MKNLKKIYVFQRYYYPFTLDLIFHKNFNKIYAIKAYLKNTIFMYFLKIEGNTKYLNISIFT